MVEKLRQLKEKSHMTNQQIAEKSNLPESTVARIFSGKTPNPTITTAVSMARAMGGSAADFFNEENGGKTKENPEPAEKDQTEESTIVCPKSAFTFEPDKSAAVQNGSNPSSPQENLLKESSSFKKTYEEILDFYKNALKKKDEWIVRLFWCLMVIVAFILFVLIFDILSPGFGFVKY